MEPVKFDSRRFRGVFVLMLLAGTGFVFFSVIWPLLQALVLGALLAGLSQPLFRRLVVVCRGHRTAASALTILIVALVIIGPLAMLLGLVAKQAISVSDYAIPWIQQNLGSGEAGSLRAWLVGQTPWLDEILPKREQFATGVANAASAAGGMLVSSLSTLTALGATATLNAFVMLYAMFFFLKDGRGILDRVLYYLPLDADEEVPMVRRFASVTRATIKGTLLIGLIQGALGGLAFFVAGISGAAFWGAIMVVLSILPGIGSALVWVPGVVYLYASGQPVAATGLLVWCAGVVSTIDNILRPPLVGKDAQMPDLLILVGTIGGLFLFGPAGFIFGPIACALFLTALDIYAVAFRDVLPAPLGKKPAPLTRDDAPTSPALAGGAPVDQDASA